MGLTTEGKAAEERKGFQTSSVTGQSGRQANAGQREGASGTWPFSYRHKTHFGILWDL